MTKSYCWTTVGQRHEPDPVPNASMYPDLCRAYWRGACGPFAFIWQGSGEEAHVDRLEPGFGAQATARIERKATSRSRLQARSSESERRMRLRPLRSTSA